MEYSYGNKLGKIKLHKIYLAIQYGALYNS